MHILVHQFYRRGDMVTIRDDQSGIIFQYRYHHRFCIEQRVNFPAVYHSPDLQEAEQHLVLSLQYDMIRSSDTGIIK